MAINLGDQVNIDKSNLAAYPNGQIQDNDGSGNGTPINRVTASDVWEFFDKLMRLSAQPYTGDYDNETNGYQFVAAAIALASKSDYVLALTTSAGVLQIQTNLDILKLDEKLIVQAVTDYTTETQIKGSTATLLTVTITIQYKAGDYLMLRRTSGGVTLVIMATADNLNRIAAANNFLKAAANSDETTGTSTILATTPASGKFIFTKRVTDPAAAIPYLATDSTPGLMSAADKTALDGFTTPVKNVGFMSGVDITGNTIGSLLTVGGDITSCTAAGIDAAFPAAQEYVIVFANAMADTNYFVRTAVESLTAVANYDASLVMPAFRNKTTTGFSIILRETITVAQNIKLWIEVVAA